MARKDQNTYSNHSGTSVFLKFRFPDIFWDLGVLCHKALAQCRLKKKIDERQKKVFPKIFFSDENLKNCGIYFVIKNFCYLCSASVSDRNHFTEAKDENVNKKEKPIDRSIFQKNRRNLDNFSCPFQIIAL